MRHEPTRRVTAVLTALAEGGPPPTLTELARSTGSSRSTLQAVLEELEAQRWVERSGPGWRAGPEVRRLAAGLAAEPDLARTARGPLEALVDATGITAVTSEVREGMSEVVDVVGAGLRTATRAAVPLGQAVPVRAPFARELVAGAPMAEQRRWWGGSPGLTPAARERLEVVLPQIARRGWSLERLTPGRRELLRMADALETAGVGQLVRERVSELFAELSEIDVTDAELQSAGDLAVASIAAPVHRPDGRIAGSVAVLPGRRMAGHAVSRTLSALTDCAREVSARLATGPAPAAAPGPPGHLVHPAHAARS